MRSRSILENAVTVIGFTAADASYCSFHHSCKQREGSTCRLCAVLNFNLKGTLSLSLLSSTPNLKMTPLEISHAAAIPACAEPLRVVVTLWFAS